MFKYYNANPVNNYVGDCVVRAISTLNGKDWMTTKIEIFIESCLMYDISTSNKVWHNYLKKQGYSRFVIPNTCPYCYTVKQFCKDHPYGKYLLALDGHVVAVIDGDYYDTWDSGNEVPIYFWKKEL
jgi:hypothetical protein